MIKIRPELTQIGRRDESLAARDLAPWCRQRIRSIDELAPGPRRRDRQGLRGDPHDVRRAAARSRPRLVGVHKGRVIAELFGKDEGYCRGRAGGMHIGDFSTGNLGANAIVGGSVPIATGAPMAHRYEQNGKAVCCFAGNGAYANGIVLESLNSAAQAQWTDHLAGFDT